MNWKQDAHDFKILLKRSLGKRVPQQVLDRPKFGFDTPLHRWVKEPAIFELLKFLPEGFAAKQALFNPRAISALVQDAATAGKFARRVWNLFVLEVWLQVNRRLSAPQETLSQLLEVAV